MRKVVLATFGLLVFALPQVAGADSFGASFTYAAKFICGVSSGGDSRLGAIEGHYNTTNNLQGTRSGTKLAFRATPVISDLELSTGMPSSFSSRINFDTDHALGLTCRDIKSRIGAANQEGYVEGFVNIYSTKRLNVVSLLTGAENNDGDFLSVMQLLPASEATSAEVVEYESNNEE